jgi:methionyl-tRNA formyltransferase
MPAAAIANHVRGMTPWPGAHTFIKDKEKLKMLKIARARPLPTENGRPGEIIRAKDRLVVAAGEGAVEVLILQLEGKRQMRAEEFLRGHRVNEGTLLS